MRAEPAGSGWRFTGVSDWCTGWGLIDLVMIAGTTADDRIVLALLPARERAGLRAGPPLRLSVMGGTHTVALTIDDLAVAADDVLAVIDGAAWRAADTARTANAMPAAIGLLRRVVVALAPLGEERGRPEALHAAFHLGGHGAALRKRATPAASRCRRPSGCPSAPRCAASWPGSRCVRRRHSSPPGRAARCSPTAPSSAGHARRRSTSCRRRRRSAPPSSPPSPAEPAARREPGEAPLRNVDSQAMTHGRPQARVDPICHPRPS